MLRAKLSQSLAMALVYERPHEDCRMIHNRQLSLKQVQMLVQVWKQLWKWL